MKKNTKLMVLGIYIGIIITCMIITNYNYKSIYNSVTVINDRDEVVKKINMSIPIKIKISNEIWGDYVFESENYIQKIWGLINDITDNDDLLSKDNLENSDVFIKGQVEYLNGNRDNFQVGNTFKLNSVVYNSNSELPLISSLKNELLVNLYSAKNIASIVEKSSKIHILTSNDDIYELNEYNKQFIKKLIFSSEKIDSNKEIMTLETNKEKAIAHIRIYIKNEDHIKVKSSYVVNIDVYDNNFFVMQYMGDENGRHVYFKSNLGETCKKIIRGEL